MAPTKKPQRKGKKIASMEERFPMNISLKLFNAWQKMRRKGDPELLQNELGLSRPIIDRALNFGHIKNEKNAERISNFFMKRLEYEKANPQPPVGKKSKLLIESIS